MPTGNLQHFQIGIANSENHDSVAGEPRETVRSAVSEIQHLREQKFPGRAETGSVRTEDTGHIVS